VSYFAVALAKGQSGWATGELDLGRPSDLSDVEEVADLLRDFDTDAPVSLLLVEVDDEYLAILRLDEGGDLRVFGSDEAFVDESPIGAVLLGEEDRPAPIELPDEDFDSDEYSEEPPAAPDGVEPIGDAELLADLGVSGARLLALVAAEGKMPSDVTSEICAVLGCADEVEELR
jgi:putative tRNA adenosine deaminase-associated protein